MSISVSENINFMVQSNGLVNVINAPYSLTDTASTDSEYTSTPLSIPAGTTLLALAPATFAFGRLKTIYKLFIQTDAPCTLGIDFTGGGTYQQIPLQNVLLLNGTIKALQVSTGAVASNLIIAAAGLLV